MTLRDRCKELVREWRAGPNRVIVSGERPDYLDVCDSVMDTAANIAADQLQAALDATEGEAGDGEPKLPELPQATVWFKRDDDPSAWNYENNPAWHAKYGDDYAPLYTAAQMHTYARAAVEQASDTRRLAKHQPCGCVVCTCGDEERCHGCGARSCGTHPVGALPSPVYAVEQAKPEGDAATALERYVARRTPRDNDR